MRKSGKILGCCLITVSLLACTACSGFDKVKYNQPDQVVKAMDGAFAQWDAMWA